MSRLRVLTVTPRYLPEIGGVERHVHEVATRIAAAGAEVTVLTTDRSGALPAQDADGPVAVRRVRAHPRGRDWLFAPGIRAVIAAGGWDVIHVQSYHTFVAPMAMRAAARLGIPYVVTFHGGGHSSPLRHRLRRAQRQMLRPQLARAARLVAVASFEIDEYSRELRLPRERFALIPNGVDLPAAGTVDAAVARELPSGSPLIASVGRLERYKGHQRVIAAFPEVLAAEPGARLWIAGAGPYEPELRGLAHDLGVADRVDVRAVAAGDRAAMAAALSRTDLVVLLSDFETHPIAALEALSLGRPLLVADGSGLGELASRGLARSIAVDAPPHAAAEAMLRELRDPLVPPHVDLPTWDDCAAGLLSLYESVAGGAACAS